MRTKEDNSGKFPSLITKLAANMSKNVSQLSLQNHSSAISEKDTTDTNVVDTPLGGSMCPRSGTTETCQENLIRFDDIENVLASYESQHRKLYIRNKYKSKRWVSKVLYDVSKSCISPVIVLGMPPDILTVLHFWDSH